jgi:predicted nucleic acid-binding protein
MILVDSSAWVEYDRATGSSVDLRLAELIADDGPIAYTEPILMEVAAGARDDRRESDLRRLLQRGTLLAFDAVSDVDAAVRIYRACRQRGVTPRGLVDCMIAAVAMRCDANVLAHDVDFARIGQVMALEMDPASLDA